MDKNPFGSGTSSWEEVGVLAILDERRLFTGSAEAERVARQAVKDRREQIRLSLGQKPSSTCLQGYCG
jgi:hypothetical protein